MADDELSTSVLHQRIIDTGHFGRGDVVHAIGSLLEAQHIGRPLMLYRVTGQTAWHLSGEQAHILETEQRPGRAAVRAPARYLIHLENCPPCARFEGQLREEITSGDFGDAEPHEVMLIARTQDGQLVHILDVLRLEGGQGG
ncbi:hypothetical protein ACFYMW_35990 [Streptomyces sp. NPDC006692]|uniref:hypothetical protein n=1 Tax=unclassified Streptomyces TaxID=2593676 RepID=UPI00343B1F5C